MGSDWQRGFEGEWATVVWTATSPDGRMRVRMTVNAVVGAVLASSVLFGTTAAWAQKKPRVVTISEVTIVGRVQKPIAAVDVSRIQPKLVLGEMRTPFLERIEKAVHREPF
jgi:hypothetical protein